MKSADAVIQMRMIIPQLTNLFTDELTITAMTNVSGIVTITTSVDHDLQINDLVNVIGTKTPLPIDTLTQTNNVADALLVGTHDLTFNTGIPQTVEIEGATESDYNGTFPLLSTPNLKRFTYQISNDPTSPATGTPLYLQDDILGGYNGPHIVTGVPASNQFIISIAQTDLPDPRIDNAILRVRHRISHDGTLEQFTSRYSKQPTNEYWGCFILDDRFLSKNRQTLSDAAYTPTTGDAYRLRLIKPFSLYVFIPLPNVDSFGIKRDSMEDIESFLLKTFAGWKAPTSLVNQNVIQTSYTGNGIFSYNGAYYVHQFTFEIEEDVVTEDTLASQSIAVHELFGDINDSWEVDIDRTEDV